MHSGTRWDCCTSTGWFLFTTGCHAATATLKMIFEHGLFHADPHPGNFFIEPDGRPGLIDFGMVGTVDSTTRAALRGLLVALVTQDIAPLVDSFIGLGVTTTPPDRAALARDFERLMADHLFRPLGKIALGPMLRDSLTIVRRHRLPSAAEPGTARQDACDVRRDRSATRSRLRDDRRDRPVPTSPRSAGTGSPRDPARRDRHVGGSRSIASKW
jgi:hypothetical protein